MNTVLAFLFDSNMSQVTYHVRIHIELSLELVEELSNGVVFCDMTCVSLWLSDGTCSISRNLRNREGQVDQVWKKFFESREIGAGDVRSAFDKI